MQNNLLSQTLRKHPSQLIFQMLCRVVTVFYLNVLNIYLYLQDILEVADDCFSSHIWGVICLIHTGIHIGNGNIEPGTKFLLIHQLKVSKCQFPHHNFANVLL